MHVRRASSVTSPSTCLIRDDETDRARGRCQRSHDVRGGGLPSPHIGGDGNRCCPELFFFLLNWGCAVRTELIVTGSAHSSHGLELFQGGTALHGVSLISLENLGHTSGGKNPFPSARVQAAVIDRRSPDTRGLRPARRRFWVGGGHSCWVYIGNYFLIDRLVWVRIIALLARANTEFINNWIRNKRNGKRQYFTIHNMSIAVETHHDERTKYGDQDIASKCRMSERNH